MENNHHSNARYRGKKGRKGEELLNKGQMQIKVHLSSTCEALMHLPIFVKSEEYLS